MFGVNHLQENLIQNMLKSNPMMEQIMKELKENGGDAKSLFYQKAKEMGINPDDILKQIPSYMR